MANQTKVLETRTEISVRRQFNHRVIADGFLKVDIVVFRKFKRDRWPAHPVEVMKLHEEVKREVDKVIESLLPKHKTFAPPLPDVLEAILEIPGVTEVHATDTFGMRARSLNETKTVVHHRINSEND